MTDRVVGECEADALDLLDRLNVGVESNLIAVLQSVQESLGYLPGPVIEEISNCMQIPLAKIYGVITFYAQFHTEPRGKHTVRCCRGTACHVRGAKSVLNAVRRTLEIEDGETTDDMMFTFETVACLGACALAPVVIVDNTYYGKATPRRVQDILQWIAEESKR